MGLVMNLGEVDEEEESCEGGSLFRLVDSKRSSLVSVTEGGPPLRRKPNHNT